VSMVHYKRAVFSVKVFYWHVGGCDMLLSNK